MAKAAPPRAYLPPVLPSRLVHRPRLLDALDAPGPGLTLLTGAPGSGKTVALTDWVGQRAPGARWLHLERHDDDPQLFWPRFLGAVRGRPGPGPSSWGPGALVGALEQHFGLGGAAPAAPAVLVLDDAQVLTHQEILDGLDLVAREWSGRLRLVLAARSVPLLPFHRYRLEGLLHEVRGHDLAMTPTEAAELLAAHDVVLPARELRVLMDQTEGWTSGLRLAAMRMQGMPRPADFVGQLAVDSGSVGEYLIEEVLARQPAQVRRLLVATSVLDVVTVRSAEALTSTPDAAATLSALARANSFVQPVGAAATAYRYHPLFREVLRYLLECEPADAVAQVHRRAAVHLRAEGDLPGALRASLRGGDAAHARSVLVRGGFAEVVVAHLDLRTVASDGLPWLLSAEPDPEADAGARAEWHAARWAVAAATADSETAREELARLSADHEGDLAAVTDVELQVTTLLAELLLCARAGEWVRGESAARILLDDPSLRRVVAGVPGLRPTILLQQARMRFGAGRPEELEPLLAEALAGARRDGAPPVELEVLSVQAMVGATWARERHREQAATRAVALSKEHPTLAVPVPLSLAVAWSAFMRGDTDAMVAAMDLVDDQGPQYDDPGVAATVVLFRGLVMARHGELAGARALLSTAPALQGPALGLLGVYRDSALADLETALGRARAALRLLAPYAGTAYEVAVSVPTARARLALGNLPAAQAAVRRVLTTPSQLVSRHMLVDAMLCGATISLSSGDRARSLELVSQALDLAAGEIVLPFIAVEGALADLLVDHPSVARGWPSTPAQQGGGAPAAPPRRVWALSPETSMVAPLTDRERAVLRLMATTMSTAEIADELCLSVNTVKTHLAAIYRKMAVGRRREAISRARQLELL